MRSESFPAMGATRMISTVIGRNAAPAWTAEKPRMFCMYSETKKKTPNIARPTISITTFAPAKVPFLNSVRSSIGTR